MTPTPTSDWYDRRPLQASDISYDPNFLWDLGNGDYRGLSTPIEAKITIPKWDGVVHLVCVPKNGNLSAGRVFEISIGTQYVDQGAFASAGGAGISSAIMHCNLDENGLNLFLSNVPKCTMVICWRGQFVARIMYGEESEIPTLRALPVPFGGEWSDGTQSQLTVDDNMCYLVVQPENTINVYGFNLLDDSVVPIVKGDEAGEGVACGVVGGDYGIEVTMPAVDFEHCYLFEQVYWLELAEI